MWTTVTRATRGSAGRKSVTVFDFLGCNQKCFVVQVLESVDVWESLSPKTKGTR